MIRALVYECVYVMDYVHVHVHIGVFNIICTCVVYVCCVCHREL